MCPNANGGVAAVLGKRHLCLSHFQRLLEYNSELVHVELSNYGEMFLNPKLPDILACAFGYGVSTSAVNGCNLNAASEAALEAVVKYQLAWLTCSVDGATPQTYRTYRVGGSLQRVLAHIDQIRAFRNRYESVFPFLTWSFVIFGHNEHELVAARDLALSRGMSFHPKLSWDPGYSPIRDRELIRRETGLDASVVEYESSHGVTYTRAICRQLWHLPAVNCDGRLLGCCANWWCDFGINVFETGLEAAMQDPKVEYARSMLMGLAEPRPDIPCSTCHEYAQMRASANWLTPGEVATIETSMYLIAIRLRGMAPGAMIEAAACGQLETATLPDFERSKRTFRAGADRAIYVSIAEPGTYTLFLRPVSNGTDHRNVLQRAFTVVARPARQELALTVPSEFSSGVLQEQDDRGHWAQVLVQ